MPQDKYTGVAANNFGKKAGKMIAQKLGLKLLSSRSNEVQYDGKKAVLKSAHLGNLYIGVTLKMLKRIELIIAALENNDGMFDLYTLDVETYKRNIRIGHHEHIALVRKKLFLEEGVFLKTMKLDV